MTPLDFYQKKILSGEILEDPLQYQAILKFQELYEALISKPGKNRWLPFTKQQSTLSKKGIYLWGDVGIGKTFLVDTFFYCLPFSEKLRIHFYQFMQKVHADLYELQQQGIANPLSHIAKQWAEKVRVICFDELIVDDVADAMLLEELITQLLKSHVYLVFTSNLAPEDLYKNGLQRQRFIPAIDAIKHVLEVIHLTTQEDYRTTHHVSAEQRYWYPLTSKNQQRLATAFSQYSHNLPITTQPLEICGRNITIKAQAGKTVWFEFSHICGRPRGNQDYLALSKQFERVFVSGIPVIHEREHDLIVSFIQLVDVFYDAGVKLVMSGAVPIEQIYPSGKFAFAFQRTVSRLKEVVG